MLLSAMIKHITVRRGLTATPNPICPLENLVGSAAQAALLDGRRGYRQSEKSSPLGRLLNAYANVIKEPESVNKLQG